MSVGGSERRKERSDGGEVDIGKDYWPSGHTRVGDTKGEKRGEKGGEDEEADYVGRSIGTKKKEGKKGVKRKGKGAS